MDICGRICYTGITIQSRGEPTMENYTYYYARVSSRDQNPDRQIQAFRELGATDRYIIIDHSSGKDTDRPGYLALRNTILRRGDTLVVTSLDRLSRSKADIRDELQYFKDSGIRVKILDLPTSLLDVPTGQEWVFEMVNNILIEVLGTIAEQERAMIRRRQEEGLAAARARGAHIGRPAVTFPPNWDSVYLAWKSGAITAVEAMRRTGTKKSTFYKLVNKFESGEK